MRKLTVYSKTGYRVKDVNTPIIIRDTRGILFYSTEDKVPDVKEFNLPPGEYFVDQGSFTPMLFPRVYPSIKLPRRQRFFYPNPKDYKVVFGDNPNKCSVDWEKKIIKFDKSFEEKPMYEIDFILCHEFGHRFYKTEKYCDLYAARCLLKMGYNPSQVGLAPIDSLSDEQEERKMYIIDHVSNK